MPDEHAILSPSSSSRWLQCNPSARLEQEFDEHDTTASLQGTAAHSMAAHKVLRKLKRQSTRQGTIFDDDEMEAYTDDYAKYVFEQYRRALHYDPNAQIFIEQRVDFSCYVPEGMGTTDALIVSKGRIHVIDLKYGQGVVVSAEKNTQMSLYSLGAFRKFEKEYNIKRCKMTIYQPRRDNVSTWQITAYQLRKWAKNYLVPRAEKAFKGEGEYLPGPHCLFCKAAVKCRARAKEQLEVAKKEFKEPPLMSDNEIEEILAKIPAIKKWIDDIWDYATKTSIGGTKTWGSVKLVEGKANRKFVDDQKVVEAANKAGFFDIYKKTLLSVSDMEKLMTKKRFNEVLGELVTKPQGKPTLVTLDDPRNPILVDAKSEFTAYKEEK
jgi:hypothetical protein